MKVFLSWSGDTSRQVAEALREWLPNVIQALEPWMSAEDIDKGARWSSDVASELEDSKAGILCVTPDNVEAPWLLFEAGALSKTIEKTFVCPYLVGLGPNDLGGPLVQFQAAESNQDDTRGLVQTLNRALGEQALTEKQLDKMFDTFWPELARNLKTIPSGEVASGKAAHAPQRPQREILEEVLALAREQAKGAMEQAERTRQTMVKLRDDLEYLHRLSDMRRSPQLTRSLIETDLDGTPTRGDDTAHLIERNVRHYIDVEKKALKHRIEFEQKLTPKRRKKAG